MEGSLTATLVGVVIVVALVLLVVETRIMRKPDEDRSDRERAFIRADRATAKGGQFYGRNVAPFLGMAAGLLLIVLSIPFWIQGNVGGAVFVTVLGIAAVVGLFFLRRFIVRRHGAEWREQQDDLNRESDKAGTPRWFTNIKGGLGMAAGFTAFGIAALVADLTGKNHAVSWTGVGLVVCGLVLGILALIQRRAERNKT